MTNTWGHGRLGDTVVAQLAGQHTVSDAQALCGELPTEIGCGHDRLGRDPHLGDPIRVERERGGGAGLELDLFGDEFAVDLDQTRHPFEVDPERDDLTRQRRVDGTGRRGVVGQILPGCVEQFGRDRHVARIDVVVAYLADHADLVVDQDE